jgi:hypothetical protein
MEGEIKIRNEMICLGLQNTLNGWSIQANDYTPQTARRFIFGNFAMKKTNLFSPHGLSTFGITTALIVKLIIGAKGISTLAESILTL